MIDLDLRLVRYAVALADTLHFRRAAERLAITQQTLSAQIMQLESRLGVTLFVRDKRHVRLTEHGRTFIEGGRRLLAEADALVAEFQVNAAPLRIDVVGHGLTPAILGPLLRTRQGLMIETRELHGEIASIPQLAAGDLDLAFGRSFPGELPAGIARELVSLDAVRLVLPVEHPLATEAIVHLSRLRGLEIVVHAPRPAYGWQVWQEELVSRFGLRANGRFFSDGTTMVAAAAVESGLPGLTTATRFSTNSVVVKDVVDPTPLFPWHMFWRAQPRYQRIVQLCRVVRATVAELDLLRPPADPWWLPEQDLRDRDAGKTGRSDR